MNFYGRFLYGIIFQVLSGININYRHYDNDNSVSCYPQGKQKEKGASK